MKYLVQLNPTSYLRRMNKGWRYRMVDRTMATPFTDEAVAGAWVEQAKVVHPLAKIVELYDGQDRANFKANGATD